MYVPEHFAARPEDVEQLLRNLGAADLVTVTAKGLLATMLPLAWDPPGSRPDTGPAGSVVGHVARTNRQWREPPLGPAMVIARGPDAYVSPRWYPTKREHGRVVPTWNYVIAHLHGELVIHDDPGWLEGNVRRLTARHEAASPEPWTVDDAPRAYVEGQLRAIVGVEVRIDRIEAKLKLSQNRSTDDVDAVIAAYDDSGDRPMADAMRRVRARR